MSRMKNRGGAAALVALLSFSSVALHSRTAKAEIGVLEAALIGAGIGAVVGLVYALATAGGEDEKDKDREEEAEEAARKIAPARTAQVQRFLAPIPGGSESRNRHAPPGGLMIRF
jgi:hypothetical protein